ncbi:MAG: AAA family ATPase [Phycisphaeraceae bacterium]
MSLREQSKDEGRAALEAMRAGDHEKLVEIASKWGCSVDELRGAVYSASELNGEAADDGGAIRELVMRRGADINDAHARHLWRRRFCRGINVLFSRPGWGKTTIACNIAGYVTTGQPLPDGTPCDQGMVLYLKGEGSDASLRDRMQQAGADPSRYILVSRATGSGDAMIDLALDTPAVARALDQHPDTRLIVVDTLDSMFPSMRMIDNANIRRCLWPLQQLVEERDICTLILAHTNKGQYADPLDRLSGGRAIGGAARSVWCLGKLDHDADEHFMAPVKINDFAPAPAITYQFVALTPDKPAAIRWGDEREDVSAWDLDRPQQAGNSSKGEECQAWLSELLAAGPVETREATQKAEQQGYGRRVLGRAKDALHVESAAAKGARPTRWYLCLPGQEAPGLTPAEEPKGAHPPIAP